MYADIVIDISHESLDRPFQYRIPESLVGQVQLILILIGLRNLQKLFQMIIHQIRQELHLPFGCIGSMAEI